VVPLTSHFGKKKLISYQECQKLGDFDVWPFFKKEAFEEQLQTRTFLAGDK